jgi:uncharacterized phage protein (TIGR01671 family)
MELFKFKAYMPKENKTYDVSEINLSKEKVFVWVKDKLGSLITIDLDFSEVKILQAIGQKDKNGEDIYNGDVLLHPNGVGYLYYDKEDVGYMVKEIAGGQFYGYYMEHTSWSNTTVIGNIYEDNLIEKYQYGITASGKPVTRESAKKKIITVIKKGWHSKGTYVPTQAAIPERIGIHNQEVITELRDELVREGKIIQDPIRPWMCKCD